MSQNFNTIPQAAEILAALDALEAMPKAADSEETLFELAEVKEKLRLKTDQQARALKKLDKLVAKIEKIDAA